MDPIPDGGGPGHPDPIPDAVAERWETVLEDADATAAEYEEDGWETLLLHPGDVTPLTAESFGLDVLLPGNEYEALTEAVEDATVDSFQVFRAVEEGTYYYVVAFEATEADLAVVCPLFVPGPAADRIEAQAREAGRLPIHARPLSDDSRVTFTSEDPELFF